MCNFLKFAFQIHRKSCKSVFIVYCLFCCYLIFLISISFFLLDINYSLNWESWVFCVSEKKSPNSKFRNFSSKYLNPIIIQNLEKLIRLWGYNVKLGKCTEFTYLKLKFPYFFLNLWSSQGFWRLLSLVKFETVRVTMMKLLNKLNLLLTSNWTKKIILCIIQKTMNCFKVIIESWILLKTILLCY